jgi:hypothetical protein
MRINEEVLEGEVTAPVYKSEINGREGSAALIMQQPSIHKSWN